MAYSRLMELASQAEAEGVTLGELLARDLGSEELDSVQAELSSEISEGYTSIGAFMEGVDVPSIEEFLDYGPEEWLKYMTEEEQELSDSG